jgi:alkylated DNA repair dioxygenase AlkB
MLPFGLGFGANFQAFAPAPELPFVLTSVRSAAAEAVGLSAPQFNQALVQLYPRGATIGWHRDAAIFGPAIVGVSFGAPATLRFRNESRAETLSVNIPARSVYVLAGSCRHAWQHSIAPLSGQRLSITFRSFAVPIVPTDDAG